MFGVARFGHNDTLATMSPAKFSNKTAFPCQCTCCSAHWNNEVQLALFQRLSDLHLKLSQVRSFHIALEDGMFMRVAQ
jgi:hypothetical protein